MSSSCGGGNELGTYPKIDAIGDLVIGDKNVGDLAMVLVPSGQECG